MKRLFFDKLIMASQTEKSARRVQFHPRMTVIKGENDTGKSSLIKTLYYTLGAEPPHIHPTWKTLNVISALSFRIDEDRYRILRTGNRFTLFGRNDELIGIFNSVTKELAPRFSELFEFRLRLKARNDEAAQASPAFLFLPFYLDQDSSWSENWSSFERLRQFGSYRADLVAYHAGIRPNEFFDAKAQLSSKNSEVESLHSERVVVERAIKAVDDVTESQWYDIDINTYHDEIARLLVVCNRLRAEEDTLRRELSNLYSQKLVLESQLAIVRAAATEIGEDFHFLEGCEDREIDCPTCGAVYENSFRERFEIAADEDECRVLLTTLYDQLRAVDVEIENVEQNVASKSDEFREIQQILNARRGDVRLKDIVVGEGRKEVQSRLRHDADILDTKLAELSRDISAIREDMKKFTDQKRGSEIREFYLARMRTYLQELEVLRLSEESYKRIDARIKESGSDAPRALLAYYFSILHVVAKFSTSTFCPIVIDSPKQQDQDDKNWRKMMEFIRDRRPAGSQTVLALVDDAGVAIEGDMIVLDREYHVLRPEEYDAVNEELRPLLDASLTG